jgi:drug/metabolite transporter (DMT)-like permease
VVVFGFCVTTAMAALLWLWAIPYLPGIAWAALPASVWTGIVYLAIFTSAITVLLLQHATLLLPSAKVMAYTYLVPSWVILWEIARGSGLPPVVILAGVALTVLSLLMLLRSDRVQPSGGTSSSLARNRSKASRLTGSN